VTGGRAGFRVLCRLWLLVVRLDGDRRCCACIKKAIDAPTIARIHRRLSIF
jgi:hypothetical protein